MSSSCWKCFDEYILSNLDFLHKPQTFPITKQTTKSYCGITLSLTMIGIILGLIINEIISFKTNYSISYSQEFIKSNEWSEKQITIGFNVSKDWENKVNFTLLDKDNYEIVLKRCDENLNLIDSKNGTYFCIVNNTIGINYLTSHTLKLNIDLKEYHEEEDRIPFSIAIKEPDIDHDNYDIPLNINHSNVDKFRCFFNTKEVTEFRRNLRFVNYISAGGFNFNKKEVAEGIYLDDFEDSRSSKSSKDVGKSLGSYRILVSKKKDVYIRKHIDILGFISKIGGYISSLMTTFGIISLILVNKNDNYRIFDYLIKKNSENSENLEKIEKEKELIYDYYIGKTDKNEFIDLQNFKNKIDENNNKCQKFKNKCFFLCSCCCKKRNLAFSIVNDYINENLTIDNYLDNQIKARGLENLDKLEKLKKKYKSKKGLDKKNNIITDKDYKIKDLNNSLGMGESLLEDKEENIEKIELVKIDDNNIERKASEPQLEITSFTQKEREDIIKIVLSLF